MMKNSSVKVQLREIDPEGAVRLMAALLRTIQPQKRAKVICALKKKRVENHP